MPHSIRVFITDAVVPPDMLVGEVGQGWAVTTTTLMHERAVPTGCAHGLRDPTGRGRCYEEERAEIKTTMEPYKWYPQRAGRVI